GLTPPADSIRVEFGTILQFPGREFAQASTIDDGTFARLGGVLGLLVSLDDYGVPEQNFRLSEALNEKPSGTITVSPGAYFNALDLDQATDLSDLFIEIGETIAHEVGHELGLRHTANELKLPDGSTVIRQVPSGTNDVMSALTDLQNTVEFTVTDPAVRVALGIDDR